MATTRNPPAKPRAVAPEQIALFGNQETPDAFRKAVQVVHSKPKSPLTLLQRKVGNAWIKHALEHSPDAQGWWQIGFGAMTQTVGFDSNNRQYLKEAAEALMRVVFEWDIIAPQAKRMHWKASVLFPEIEIHSDCIRFQISSQMREKMISPEVYALIDMNIVRRFRRAASLAIWEFCVRFEKLGRTAEVPWETFRDMVLGESADNKTYQDYKYFKSKVLLPAITEINAQSDHLITMLETKAGRRITSLRFDLVRKTPTEDAADQHPKLDITADLVRLGIPPSEARALLERYPESDIGRALTYTQQRHADPKMSRLDNPASYFRQALLQGYGRHANSPTAKPGTSPTQNTTPLAAAEPTASFTTAHPPGAKLGRIPSVKQDKQPDLRAMFQTHQREQAKRYFDELDPTDQAPLLDAYNAQQATELLKLTKRPRKVALVAFHQWLAQHTWGEPDPEALLAFAQYLLGEKESLSASRKLR